MLLRYLILARCCMKYKITNSEGAEFVISVLYFVGRVAYCKGLMHKLLQVAHPIQNGLLQGVDD